MRHHHHHQQEKEDEDDAPPPFQSQKQKPQDTLAATASQQQRQLVTTTTTITNKMEMADEMIKMSVSSVAMQSTSGELLLLGPKDNQAIDQLDKATTNKISNSNRSSSIKGKQHQQQQQQIDKQKIINNNPNNKSMTTKLAKIRRRKIATKITKIKKLASMGATPISLASTTIATPATPATSPEGQRLPSTDDIDLEANNDDGGITTIKVKVEVDAENHNNDDGNQQQHQHRQQNPNNHQYPNPNPNHHHHHHNHNHHHPHRTPQDEANVGDDSVTAVNSLQRFRPDDRLSEAQLDRLSSLIKIIRNGDYNEFSELLERRSFKNLLNVFVDGQTALHYTLLYGRSLSWLKQLVLNGANPNLTNRAGWHPIHLAAFNGSRETMRYLIDCESSQGTDSTLGFLSPVRDQVRVQDEVSSRPKLSSNC